MGNREWRIQLVDGFDGTNIVTAGGTVHVATAGSPDKATLYDKDGAALSNPLQSTLGITRGFINFFCVDTVASVDLYIMAPGGQFVVATSVVPGDRNEIIVPTSNKHQTYVIPFSITDSTAATEKDTGFDFPTGSWALGLIGGLAVRCTTLDSGQNILFGLLSTETNGDADGLSTNVALTTAIVRNAINGALFPTNAPYQADSTVAKSISYTLDSGTDTGKGFLHIPVRLS